jgi:hypothetical protein
MTRRDVVIDANGWAQSKYGRRWRPSMRRAGRTGLPWTPAEDRDLLRRVAGARSVGYADPTIQDAAVAHGRSSCSVTTRVCALRAGLRLSAAAQNADLQLD